MKRKKIWICLLVLAALTLSGCMRTVDQMYSLPRRSEEYKNLQSAVDKAMPNLEYFAPLAGETQPAVQLADLDGDGTDEYLLYAKGNAERPLRILIFREVGEDYIHVETIESNGSSFDLVEYAQMDERPGLEIVIGSQLTDQVLRSVSVFTFDANMEANLLVSANYSKFLTVDLDSDNLTELFVLRPGLSETDRGVAELYGVENGVLERTNEVNMSEPVESLKRILTGKLHSGQTAVYVASTVDETALITDVYACVDGKLSNVSFSNESGTSVKTMRNYYVYADDIDSDGVVELPYLIKMRPTETDTGTERHDLIRWYAMDIDGAEIDKQYTYHNFVGGWYLELDSRWADRLAVLRNGNQYEFYLWDEEFKSTQKIMTIFALAGQNRAEQGQTEERFVLYKTDTVIYSASLEQAATAYGITQDSVTAGFKLIQQDWKTGET